MVLLWPFPSWLFYPTSLEGNDFVQISWFFLRATSNDCQSLVALKILCTVPWITFLLCCNGAQLGKFRIMPVSVDFWYQWQLIFLSWFRFMFRSRNSKSPLPFGASRVNCRFWWREFAYSRKSRGFPFTVHTMSSTYLLNDFNSSVSSFLPFSVQ